jgi:thiol-disulfide isomerase/thioredoxin
VKPSAIIGITGAVFIGLIAFVIVQFSSISGDGVSVGVGKAEACTDKGPQCLPAIELLDREGNQYTPEQLANKVVILNVWATWCRPCQAEVPDLAKIYTKYQDKDVVLLGIMTDTPSDQGFARFVASYGLNYPVVPMDPEIFEALGEPMALPTTFVYDRSGHLVAQHKGAISESKLTRLIEKHL